MTAPVRPLPARERLQALAAQFGDSARRRTTLAPEQEARFRSWYGERARLAGIAPDPDDPLHKYDYRGAFAAGEEPQVDAGDGLYHWPSRFKDNDHPNRFVAGVGDSKALDQGVARPPARDRLRALSRQVADESSLPQTNPVSDIAAQVLAAPAKMVTTTGEGALRLADKAARALGMGPSPNLSGLVTGEQPRGIFERGADALRARRETIQEVTAPESRAARIGGTAADIAANVVPFVTMGGTMGVLPGMAGSAGLTGVQSMAGRDASLTGMIADVTDDEGVTGTIERIAADPGKRVAADMAMDALISGVTYGASKALPRVRDLARDFRETFRGRRAPTEAARALPSGVYEMPGPARPVATPSRMLPAGDVRTVPETRPERLLPATGELGRPASEPLPFEPTAGPGIAQPSSWDAIDERAAIQAADEGFDPMALDLGELAGRVPSRAPRNLGAMSDDDLRALLAFRERQAAEDAGRAAMREDPRFLEMQEMNTRPSMAGRSAATVRAKGKAHLAQLTRLLGAPEEARRATGFTEDALARLEEMNLSVDDVKAIEAAARRLAQGEGVLNRLRAEAERRGLSLADESTDFPFGANIGEEVAPPSGLRNRAGAAQREAVQAIGEAGVGAAAGGTATGDIEGAVAGAAAGVGLPRVARALLRSGDEAVRASDVRVGDHPLGPRARPIIEAQSNVSPRDVEASRSAREVARVRREIEVGDLPPQPSPGEWGPEGAPVLSRGTSSAGEAVPGMRSRPGFADPFPSKEPAPAARRVGDYSDDEWDILREDLEGIADTIGSGGGARGGGALEYELIDEVGEFMQFARTRPDASLGDAFLGYLDDSGITGKAARQLRAVVEEQGLIQPKVKRPRKPSSGSLPGGRAFDIGGAAGAALKTRPGQAAALGTAGAALTEAEDERLQNTGRGLIGLAALYAGAPLIKAGGRRVGRAAKEALSESSFGRKVLDAVSYDLQAAPEVKAAVKAFEEATAMGRARGLELAERSRRLGPVADRAVSDVIERETFERTVLTPETAKQAAAVAQAISDEFTALGREKVRTGLLSGGTVAKREGRYLPRMYGATLAEDVADDVVTSTGGKKIRIKGERIRNDELRPETRNLLGEVREASFRTQAGLERGYRDVAAARLFRSLADMPGVMQNEYAEAASEMMTAQGLADAARATGDKEAAADAFKAFLAARGRVSQISQGFERAKEGFVRLPDTPAMGALRGAVVRKDVADYLNAIPSLSAPNGPFRNILSFWKRAHTVWNPGTHVGNTMSNAAMAHMGGLPLHEQPLALAKAIKDVRAYGPTTRFLAEKGVLERGLPTFGDNAVRGLTDDRTALRSLARTTRPETAKALAEGGVKPMGRVEAVARKGLSAAERAYALEDGVYRVALFNKLRKGGMGADDAADYVSKQFVDYQTRSPILGAIKNTVSPFVLYPAKAIPRFLGQVVDHPVRYLTLAALWAGLDQASRRKYGALDERDLRPAQRQDRNVGYLLPGAVQVDAITRPLIGAPKNPDDKYVFDVARWTPLSAITGSPAPGSLSFAALGEDAPAIMQPGGPWVDVGARLTNTDPFTGEKWLTDADSPADKAMKVLGGAASLALPSALSFHLPRVARDVQNADPDAAMVDAAGFLGLRPSVVRPGMQQAREQWKIERTLMEIRQNLRQDLRKAKSEERRQQLIDRATRRMQDVVSEYQTTRTP